MIQLPPLPAVDDHWMTNDHKYTAEQLRADRLAVIEACARVCAAESVVMATRDQTRGALRCADVLRALKEQIN